MSGRHKRLSFAILPLLILALMGCKDTNNRGCLGLGCLVGGSGGTPQNGTTPTTEPSPSSTNGFTCALVSDMSTVGADQEFGVTVNAQGSFTPPVEIIQGLQFPVENFWSAIKIFGSIHNTATSSLKYTGGVTLKDTKGKTASCSYSVGVLAGGSGLGSNVSCDLTASNAAPQPGEVVEFTMVGHGGDGTYTYREFSPFAGNVVPDTYLKKVDNTRSTIKFTYSTPVTRFASVVVKSGTNEGICRTPIFVGGQYPQYYDSGWDWGTLPPWYWDGGFFPPPIPITPPPSNTCNIVIQASPGIAGTLTNLKVEVPAYVGSGPFQIQSLASVNQSNGYATSNMDDLPLIARPSNLERKVRFRDPGLHRITVNYQNSAGTITGSCTAFHQAVAASKFALSPGRNESPTSSTPYVRTYAGASLAVASSASLPDFTHDGARVALGDVNGDGIADLIIGSGPDLVNVASPVYRVVVRNGANLDQVLFDFNPLPSHPDGNGGVFVAAADVNADGKAEIIVGQDGTFAAGKSGSWLKVYNVATGTPVLQNAIQPFGTTGNYGVRVAGGDVDGDGFGDIAVAAGPEGSGQVKLYSGRQLPSFVQISYPAKPMTDTGEADIHSGLFVALGDLTFDGKAEILTSMDAKSASDGTNYKRVIRAYDTTVSAFRTYQPFAFGTVYNGGIRIAAGDLDGDGRAEVLALPGTGMPADGYGTSFKAFDFVSQVLEAAFVPFWFTYDKGIHGAAGAGGL